VRLIVGIGNPGSRYINTRHNIGFQFLDFFAKEKALAFKASKFDYHFAEGEFSGAPFVLIKPDTFVNNSGIAVSECLNYYGLSVFDILVVVDDVYLDLSDIRIRNTGGDGGHKGLSSIIYHLQSNNFSRLKIGVGKDFESGNLVNYVLSNFDKNDFIKLEKSFEISTQLAESFISEGFEKMLSTFSRLKNLNNIN
jgi:PTH1 family peptidyl-tRNA hydrolase